MSNQLFTILDTTLTLIGQFQIALTAPPAAATEAANDAETLPLLTASSSALKGHVTKLSLLAVTSPFTHSAVSTVLRELNESILPSLVTASLLVTPAQYTKAFHSEVLVLVKTALTELSGLVREVKSVGEKKKQEKKDTGKESGVTKSEKDAVMLATGRTWDACDAATDVANKGVVGFVMRRVEQWRDLVRDAVEEIEDWDPEEEDDGFFDDILGDEGKNEDDDEDDDEDDEEETAALQEHKKSTLRFLKPIAQAYPAIINNRLKNAGNAPLASSLGVKKLESLMLNLQAIPDNVDEAAGALYDANFETSAEYLRKTKKCATQAVELVASPWGAADVKNDAPADKFAAWSKTWLKVIDEVSKSIEEN
ncbi:Armadillo-like helical [Penicillium expansum]|nr:Armadillo-like helical [Penicillium expansum]